MTSLSAAIKEYALELGFSACGISKVEELSIEKEHLQKWLNNDFFGKMGYMTNHLEKRLNPAKLVEDSKSVISVLLNYYNEDPILENHDYKISRYAWGADYHHVMKEKLFELLDFIRKQNNETKGRAFVDSAPVLDKAWAQKAGLGWIGKNTCLIRKNEGSFFFIGELIINLNLEYDKPIKNYCGSCTKCIDACPTGAILEPYVIDARKCISYLTIELKDYIPEEYRGKMQNYIFGCDICQNVCPWNKFAKKTEVEEFTPQEILKNTNFQTLENKEFKKLYKNSPINRIKFEKFKNNLCKIV